MDEIKQENESNTIADIPSNEIEADNRDNSVQFNTIEKDT